MKYQVVYDANTKIEMTKEEVQQFLLQLQTKEIVEFKGSFLTKFFRVITQIEQTTGRLHDGTKVVKRFGEWKDALDPTLKLDAKYYPEIANDQVLPDEEWDKKQLLLSEKIVVEDIPYDTNLPSKN